MRVLLVASAGFVAWLTASPPAEAQAWVDSAGHGAVTLAFQRIDNTGHILTDGRTKPIGKSRSAAVYLQVDYAVTDRFSFSVGLPFVFARYLGPRMTPEPPMVQAVDLCYCWQSSWQDVGITARYNLLNGSAAVTPSVSFGLPTHEYQYRGEAVVGRGLKELRVGVDAGLRLNALSPRLAIQTRYAYAIVERVLDVPNNRSNASFETLFQVSDRLGLSGTVSRQVTHGGLRAGVGPPGLPDGIPWGEITTLELFQQHDRLIRDNHWRVGGGVSMALPRADVFFSYLEYVAGSDTHAGRAFTAGLSLPFLTR